MLNVQPLNLTKVPILMIIAIAGRRIDDPKAEIARFPIASRASVEQRLKALFVEQRASGIVCAAACGADLIALDVAGSLGLKRHIILPAPLDEFRRTSVVDRPGQWGPLFDRIIDQLSVTQNVTVLENLPEGDQRYEEGNHGILNAAVRLSFAYPEAGLLAAVVWDGRPRGAGDITAHFLAEAQARGISVMEVSTL